ncbi:hypothetical protein DICPUDRAFT_30596 [Dictyostelium purpureum]|uniref:TRAF-type domain-containing protein n=1 Tax=Dictyostelium purpureum TaxID=5786 RepID=F0ZFM1_DICPU|nr:uncharacterized protein DICPUDRAFT_30596 [Dictyostelium purpureum]EGC37254.1 hypothetical protein DICPUDRAFT_30596 [Dictyostelium purpureum]|eukprot:XP_003286224.1 hypothetical protein DICPUDRAFT_30596 [Dictyostelium purpureum]
MSREPINFNILELTSVIDEYICPICMETYYKKEIYQCRQVCCPYSFKNIISVDESEILIKDGCGCKEIIKLEELDNHIENCSFRFVKCKYHENGCMDKIRYNENEIHFSKCEYQPLNCTHCSNVYLLKTIEQHYLECPLMLIDCKECNEKIKREEMGNHLDKECQEVIISCKLIQFGCNDKIKRKNLENHLDQINHSKHFSTAIENLIIKNNQLSNNKKDLIIKNNQLSNCINELTKGKEYKSKWIISNYSKINHKVDEYLISPKFGYAPDLFYIRLYKNGGSKTNIGNIGIYLHSESVQKNITFSITLLNNDTKIYTKKNITSIFHNRGK